MLVDKPEKGSDKPQINFKGKPVIIRKKEKCGLLGNYVSRVLRRTPKNSPVWAGIEGSVGTDRQSTF